MSANVLTSKDLARAIGVSESSIKRWADDGTIQAFRTAGGHRRISVPEAIRFVRESHAPLAHPELLGLTDIAAVAQDASRARESGKLLHDYLISGKAVHARGLIEGLYMAGQPVAAIVDGPIREAMTAIGELWHDPAGIMLEHRATDMCMQALRQLKMLLPESDNMLVAVGGAPEADPYAMATLAAAVVLSAEGFRAENLGPDTPFAALRKAVETLEPRLLWISVSSAPDRERLFDEIQRLARDTAPLSLSVVAGGRLLSGATLPSEPNLHIGHSMAELAAFAKGLKSAVRT